VGFEKTALVRAFEPNTQNARGQWSRSHTEMFRHFQWSYNNRNYDDKSIRHARREKCVQQFSSKI